MVLSYQIQWDRRIQWEKVFKNSNSASHRAKMGTF